MSHIAKLTKHLLKKLDEIINENLSNAELSVEILAEKMAMSRSTFYRKIKKLPT
ncbi:helix-turn-helix domain-containing protein [Flavobacterium sp. P21]|uniref:helix-turn-helix domain-containing protein n=1 Tax=Flavobacterium sp. P21 TaxID=3423948 RepID=UPI003D6668CB